MRTVTAKQSRILDSRTMDEAGIPGETLMERAGIGAGREILRFSKRLRPWTPERFVLLAGKGNNGGDAYVVARFLAGKTDAEIAVFSACPLSELTGDAKLNAERLPAEVAVSESTAPPVFRQGDFIIDGLLGTGVKGAPRSPFDKWIESVNAANSPVVALDVPSGLDCDTGEATIAVRADMTVTMAYPKRGMVLLDGPGACGTIRVVDIGVPAEFAEELGESDLELTVAADIAPMIAKIPRDTHKNARGKILVLGGSFDYPGAPLLAAEAAARSGAGVVTVAVPESAGIPPPPNARHLVFRRLPDNGGGAFSARSAEFAVELAKRSDVVVLGPGATTAEGVENVFSAVFALGKPMVVDADALNLLALGRLSLPDSAQAILTPHPGEAGRLAESLGIRPGSKTDRIDLAKTLSERFNAVVALKGNGTVVADPEGHVSVNGSGAQSLATAGSGDVLAGAMAAWAANFNSLFDAAKTAVFLHGLAGELSQSGVRGLVADDLPALLAEAAKTMSPSA